MKRNRAGSILLVLVAGALTGLWTTAGGKEKGGTVVFMAGGSPARNQANFQDRNIPDDFAVKKGMEKYVRWVAALGNKSYAGPLVAGDHIFVPTDNGRPRDSKVKGYRGVMMCFKTSTGEFLWQHAFEKGNEANDAQHEPLISVPCVEGEHLWYVNNLGEVVCSTVKGEILWKYDMVKDLDVFVGQHVYTSPLVIGDLVYAITCNGVDAHTNKLPKPKAPAIIALDRKAGKLVWSSALPSPNIIRGQWTNPSAATVDGKTQIIYGGGDGYVYGLDAKTGDLIWKFDCNPRKVKPYKVGGGGEKCFIIGTPVVYDNKVYVGVGQEPDDGPGVGHLWCIDITKKPTNKEKDLSPVNDNFDPKDPINKDSGLVWHHGGMVMPKPMNSDREYVFGRTMGTVAIADGLLYATEFAGYLQCLDAKTGTKLWEHDFQDNTWCSPYFVDGKVYVGVDSGDLYVFKAGKTLTPPRKINIGPSVKVPPVAADGVLYVNTGTALYAIKK